MATDADGVKLGFPPKRPPATAVVPWDGLIILCTPPLARVACSLAAFSTPYAGAHLDIAAASTNPTSMTKLIGLQNGLVVQKQHISPYAACAKCSQDLVRSSGF